MGPKQRAPRGKGELFMIERKVPGGGLRVAGMVLSIIAITAGVTALVLATCGMGRARVCRNCRKGAEFR